MNQNSEVVAELWEIRAELKHINQRFDEALAYQDKLAEMRFKALKLNKNNFGKLYYSKADQSLDPMRINRLIQGGSID